MNTQGLVKKILNREREREREREGGAGSERERKKRHIYRQTERDVGGRGKSDKH